MDIETLMAMTVSELRSLAEDRDVSWHDSDGKPLRKADLIDALERSFGDVEAKPEVKRDDDTMEVALPRIAAQVVEAESPKEPEPSVEQEGETQWYVVDEDAKYAIGGVAYQLKKGSVVSAATHPLDVMKEQNVPMTFMLSSKVREQAAHAQTVFADVYAEPVVQSSDHVPAATPPFVMPESAQLIDVLPDGTREPVPSSLSPMLPDVEAKVER